MPSNIFDKRKIMFASLPLDDRKAFTQVVDSQINRRRMLYYGLIGIVGVIGGLLPPLALGDSNLMHGTKKERLANMSKALLLIDIQNDYFAGGKAELFKPDEALYAAEKVLGMFRKHGLPVIHVQHINTREGATFFLSNTEGAKIHERLTPHDGESVVVKHTPNSFYNTSLSDIIREKQLSELVVCGMMTPMCVDTTVRAAKDYGISITLIHDACATKDLVFGGEKLPANMIQKAYLAGLNGMFANIIGASELQL